MIVAQGSYCKHSLKILPKALVCSVLVRAYLRVAGILPAIRGQGAPNVMNRVWEPVTPSTQIAPHGVTTNCYFPLHRRWGRRWLPWQSVQTFLSSVSVRTAVCSGVLILSLE